MTAFNPSASEAVNLTVRLCCIGRAINLAELVVARSERRTGGMLNWKIAGLILNAQPAGVSRIRASRIARLSGAVNKRCVGMSSSVFNWLLWIEAAVILGLFLFPAVLILKVIVVLCLLIEMKRHYFSVDGSDEMTLLCLTATCLAGFGDSNRYVAFFLAAELALAYTTAGAYKAASPFWQKGKALLHITRTKAFGHKQVSKLLHRYPLLSRYSELALVLWESGFLIALIAPRPVLWGILAAGVIFHLSCAGVMGLNTFLWAFSAGYPCVIFANEQLHLVLKTPVDGYLTLALSILVAGAVVFEGWRFSRSAEEEQAAAKQSPEAAGMRSLASF
ncbi:hypothetical protein ACFPT7_17685 [Acidicapsa dinghuensis]|uniref:HTTM domain-containing protein n=1 Tax=Acidicapsa dinghuensis TaxID=2218256 RepID=A0ABW1EL66_9BACT|nr:hypothetical protein [Acidicapsa dinghuensis]